MTRADPYALADRAASGIAACTGVARHDVAVVLGSGWTPVADRLGEVRAEVAFAELPGFPAVTVPGQAGLVRSIGTEAGRSVLCLLGRVHAYEGHEVAAVVHGVRAAVRAGCAVVVLTNAAGGLRPGMQAGEPVLISDHLNLTGRSPLTGPPPPAGFGDGRFVDLTDAYSPRLRRLAQRIQPGLDEGVYAGLPGPHYETPAEIRMLQVMGADLVGMSTVHETIAARHLGAEVLGLSLVTNLAAGLGGALDHGEVVDVGRRSSGRLGDLLAAVVAEL